MIVEVRYQDEVYVRYPIPKDPDKYNSRMKGSTRLNQHYYQGGFDAIVEFFKIPPFSEGAKFITNKPFRKEDWI